MRSSCRCPKLTSMRRKLTLRLRQNDTVASRGNITRSTALNEFSYEPRNLFIAYGTGFLVTSIIVAIGLICIKSISASFGKSFSTILRTTRNPHLDTIIPATETSGAEPLSKHIGKIRLILRDEAMKLENGQDGMATFFVMEDEYRGTSGDSIAEFLLHDNRTGRRSDGEIELSCMDGDLSVSRAYEDENYRGSAHRN